MNESIGSDGRHKRVFQILKKEIQKSKAGSRLESISSLSKRFSVSEITIRHALLLLAKDGLVEIKHGSGTYVKEQADERPVGVVMGIDISGPDVSYYWRRMAQQVRLLLTEQGLHNRFYVGFHPATRTGFSPPDSLSPKAACPELLDDVANNRLRGVIVVQFGYPLDWARPLQERGIPVVGFGTQFNVVFDLKAQVRAATRRLIEAGRRKLAYIGWGNVHPRPDFPDDSFDAFAGTLAEHGVPLNERWARCDFQPNLPGAGWEEFREIWTGTAENPDGLVVVDDVLFHGVARAIGEFGIRVPEQLVVVAHANRGAGDNYPFPLWRMETDPDAAAQAYVDLLLALLRGEPVAQGPVNLPVQFILPDGADNISTRETKQLTTEGSSLS